mmetsp:Transcript_20365/g.46755  ORF Transcript_20365/g.46755 Transcript_20365/m.46755 type:complete len:215 (-) Transcript_20365:3120-3764(-)
MHIVQENCTACSLKETRHALRNLEVVQDTVELHVPSIPAPNIPRLHVNSFCGSIRKCLFEPSINKQLDLLAGLVVHDRYFILDVLFKVVLELLHCWHIVDHRDTDLMVLHLNMQTSMLRPIIIPESEPALQVPCRHLERDNYRISLQLSLIANAPILSLVTIKMIYVHGRRLGKHPGTIASWNRISTLHSIIPAAPSVLTRIHVDTIPSAILPD